MYPSYHCPGGPAHQSLGSASPLACESGAPAISPDPHPLAFADGGEARNSALKYLVTIGRRVHQPASICLRDISYVLGCLRSGWVEGVDLRALIEIIRALPDPRLAAEMKRGLPWFCGSVCRGLRSNATVEDARFLIFDLDHVDQPESAKSAALNSLPWLVAAFRSVRDGVKLIAGLDAPLTREEDFRRLWEYLALQVERAVGHPVDRSGSDWSRACFFSWDPGLLYNSGWKPLGIKAALAEAELVEELTRGSGKGLDPGSAPPGSPLSVIPGLTRDPVFTERSAGDPRDGYTVDSRGTRSALDSSVTLEHRFQPVGPAEFIRPLPKQNTDKPGDRINPAGRPDKSSVPASSDDFERARTVVRQLAQMLIPYRDWVKVGLALRAGFGERGLELWLLFLDNPHYRDTPRVIHRHWRSFARVHSVNLATLFYLGVKYGCE